MRIFKFASLNSVLFGLMIAAVTVLPVFGQSVIQISSFEELCLIGTDEQYPLNGSYELTNDIDAAESREMDGGLGFKPVGSSASPFTGTFNGNNFTIKRLYINRPQSDSVGLFGVLGTGGKISAVDIAADSVIGRDFVGILAGSSAGSIDSCNSTGLVRGSNSIGGLIGQNNGGVINRCGFTGNVSGSRNVGGLVGDHMGVGASVTHSFSTGTVSGSDRYIGGLVGHATGTAASITHSYTSGTVTGGDYAGGLLGGTHNSDFGEISDCYSTAAVSGEVIVGGLIGLKTGMVSRCFAAGDVTATGTAGGLLGQNHSGRLIQSYSTGNVTGANRPTGGLVGWNRAKIYDCYSTGNVSGADSVGGLVGFTDDSIAYSYSTGTVSGTGTGVGGLIGRRSSGTPESWIVRSYWNTTSSGQISSHGETGKTSEEMKLEDTYQGWDFNAVWSIKEDDYPHLKQIIYYIHTLRYKTNGNGSIKGDSVQTVIHGLDGTEVEAVPDEGYKFVKWSDGLTSPNRTETLVKNDTTVTALFEPPASIANTDRIIPGPQTPSIEILSIMVTAGELTIGPNPVSRQTGGVKFFREGSKVEDGKLSIYNTSGSLIKVINIRDSGVYSDRSRREVGFWDLTNRKSVKVSDGNYLVKGTLNVSGGGREKVSLMIGVK